MKVLLLVIAAAVASATLSGCNLQQEGERCSVDAEQDCDEGLLCRVVDAPPCGSVCCPISGAASDPCCRGEIPSTTTTTTTTATTTTGAGGAGGTGGAGTGGAGGA